MAQSPQNKFLENIIHVTKDLDTFFFIANAQISHHPIIYCSQEFSEEFGFSRNEITRRDVYLEFLYGRQTTDEAIKVFEDGIAQKKYFQVEMILYSKSGMKRWFLVTSALVRDCEGQITFFLIFFNNITHLKPTLLDSPKRQWKKAVRKILNKPNLEAFRKNMHNKKQRRKKPLDMVTIRQRLDAVFIPEYGGEKIQVPKFVIRHAHPVKVVWDILILVWILYTATVVPFVICFSYSATLMIVLDTIVDIFFLVDIIVTFFSTYVDKQGDLVTNPKMIRMNYLKGWFVLDLVAALPYSIFSFILNASSSILDIFSAVKIVRLIRIVKAGKKLGAYMQMSAVTLGVWILIFCLCAHWMACIWYVIAFSFDGPEKTPHSWLAILADVTHERYNFTNGKLVEGSGPPMTSLYMSALYYTMSSLTTCGFGNIAPNTTAEKFFGCVTMLVGCVLYALIFGQVTNIITQFQRNTNAYTEQLNAIKQFNSIYKVPFCVAKRVENYFIATWAVTKGTNEEEILEGCPRDLQSDLCLHIHAKIFGSNRAFLQLKQTSLRVLSRYLWTIRTAPGDKLIYTGENVDTIYFIASGSLEVKSGKDLVGLIGPGDALGKRLTTDDGGLRSVYDVEACSFGAIHCISCDNVKEALELYPEEYEKIKYDLMLSFDITRQVKIITKDGELITTELPNALKDSGSNIKSTSNTYVNGDEYTAVENTPNIDVLSGMSEIKGELRRETERMNSKMGIVEAQMRLVLKMLRTNSKIQVDPEIGGQLNELMSYEENIEDVDGEWLVADSSGWKKELPARTDSAKSRSNIKVAHSVVVVDDSDSRKQKAVKENPLPASQKKNDKMNGKHEVPQELTSLSNKQSQQTDTAKNKPKGSASNSSKTQPSTKKNNNNTSGVVNLTLEDDLEDTIETIKL